MIICGGSAAPPSLIAGSIAMACRWSTLGHGERRLLRRSTSSSPACKKQDEAALLTLRAKQGVPVLGVDLRIADLDTGAECPSDGVTPEDRGAGTLGRRAYYHDPGDRENRFTADG